MSINECSLFINCLCVPSGQSNNKLFPLNESIIEAKFLSFWGTLPLVPRNVVLIGSITYELFFQIFKYAIDWLFF